MESVQRFTAFAIIPLILLVMMAIPDGVDAAWESIILPSGEVVHLGDKAGVSQELGEPGTLRQANVAFILDASGSMTAELTGAGKSRLEVAKEAMAELLPQIPAGVRCALWFYGHRYPQKPKEKSCADIEEAFSLGPIDVADYLAKINAIDAIGYTPIAGSIELAAKELPADEFNSIVLLSDGEETCGGDPCALAEALKASDAAVSIHVVGYAVEQKAREQLQCIARASGGTYHDAQDAADLLQALQEALAATIAETILRVEVVGPDGVPERADIHLYERNTENKVSSFIAHKDNAVPPGSYDLIVGTLPWTIYQDLVLPQGSTTIVRMELGAIRLLTP
ncbi:VWA domain-containing protein, partial [bacterium]|nr:VWA domain-containing protein [bacterium]